MLGASKTPSSEKYMDIIYIGAIAGFFALTCAFAAVCGKLGEQP